MRTAFPIDRTVEEIEGDEAFAPLSVSQRAAAALICGSIAYDTILVLEDRFRSHILPDRIHMLNVSFLVPRMRKEFGGCAGNIAYSLQLLGDVALPVATVGRDFGPYAAWLDRHGISRRYLKQVESELTAQAFIVVDTDNNRISAFHPGAMSLAHENRNIGMKNVRLGIVAPEGREGMIQHAEFLAASKVPFIFHPGAALSGFSRAELERLLARATWVTLNEHEWRLLQQKTGCNAVSLLEQVDALIVTLGARGSHIHTRQGKIGIPAAVPEAVVDPTGCGDAYRAGLIHGLLHRLDWETTGEIASLMGAIAVESRGPQSHRFTRGQFRRRFKENFGSLDAKRRAF